MTTYDDASLLAELESVRAELDSDRLNHEQLQHQWERSRKSLEQARELLQQDLQSARTEVEQCNVNKGKLQSELQAAQATIENLTSRTTLLEQSNQIELANRVQIIEGHALLEREIDRCRSDLDTYSEKVIQLSKQNAELDRNLIDARSQLSPLQLEVTNFQQQNQVLVAQNRSITIELEQRSTAHILLSADIAKERSRLSGQIEQFRSEADQYKTRLQTAESELRQIRTRVDQSVAERHEADQAHLQAVCQYQDELDGEKRLSTLYKRGLDESKAQVETLESSLADMRSEVSRLTTSLTVSQSNEQHVAARLSEIERQYASARRETEDIKLKAQPFLELEANTQMMNDDDAIIPASVNLTRDQLYHRLMQSGQMLITERANSRKLELYLNQIQMEVEENIPLFQEQRQDYENILRVNHTLSMRVAQANQERDVLLEKLSLLQKTCQNELVARKSIEQHALQLQKQLQVCVNKDPSSKDDLGILQLISRDLVQANDEGLQLVESGQETSAKDGESVDQYRVLIDKLQSELADRTEKLSQLEKQHEFFKSMMGMQQQSAQTISSAVLNTSVAQQVVSSDSHLSSIVESLQQQLQMVLTEKVSLESELQAELRASRQTERQMQLDLQRLNGELQIGQQKLQWSTEINEKLVEESQRLRSSESSKEAKLSILADRQIELESLVRERTSKWESAHKSQLELQAQCDLLRHQHAQLNQQAQDYEVHRARTSVILKAVQDMQHSLARQETDSKSSLIAEKERIYSEWVQVQKSAQLDRRQHSEGIKVLQVEIRTLTDNLSASNLRNEQLQQDLARLQQASVSAEAAFQSKVLELTKVVSERDILIRAASHNEGQSDQRQLHLEISLAQTEVEQLTASLSSKTAECADWHSLADEREESLSQLTVACEAYKLKMTSEMDSKLARINELTEQCRQADLQIDVLTSQIASVQSMDRDELASVRSALATAESRAEMANNQIELAQNMANQCKDLQQQAQARYESELTAHASSLAEAQSLRTRVEILEDEVRVTQSRDMDLKDNFDRLQLSSADQIRSIEIQLEQAKALASDLIAQNDLLLSQLESGQRLSVSQTSHAPDDATLTGEDAEDARIRRIISGLRLSKEVADETAEAALRQVKRLQADLDHTRQALDQTRLDLSNMSLLSSSATSSSASPIDAIEVLQESNASLRTAKLNLLEEVNSLQFQLKQITSDTEPLRLRVAGQDQAIRLLESERDSVLKEVEQWKTRNQNLLKRYNQVDPEVLAAVQSSLEQTKLMLETAQKKLLEKENQIAELQTEASQSKQLALQCANFRKSALQNQSVVNQLKKELASRSDQSGGVLAEAASLSQRMKSLIQLLNQAKLIIKQKSSSNAELQSRLTDSQGLYSALRNTNESIQTQLESELQTSKQIQVLLQAEQEANTRLQLELRSSQQAAALAASDAAAAAAFTIANRPSPSILLPDSVTGEPEVVDVTTSDQTLVRRRDPSPTPTSNALKKPKVTDSEPVSKPKLETVVPPTSMMDVDTDDHAAVEAKTNKEESVASDQQPALEIADKMDQVQESVASASNDVTAVSSDSGIPDAPEISKVLSPPVRRMRIKRGVSARPVETIAKIASTAVPVPIAPLSSVSAPDTVESDVESGEIDESEVDAESIEVQTDVRSTSVISLPEEDVGDANTETEKSLPDVAEESSTNDPSTDS